jgi:hypothetical protein
MIIKDIRLTAPCARCKVEVAIGYTAYPIGHSMYVWKLHQIGGQLI